MSATTTALDEIVAENAELFATTYRLLRVLVLMDESGIDDYYGISREESLEKFNVLRARLGELVEDPELSQVVRRFLAARAHHLNTMPYEDYLASPEWHDTRYFARRLAGDRCRACNRSGRLDVHHRTYERRGAEHLDDLTVLCREHHQLFHEAGGLA